MFQCGYISSSSGSSSSSSSGQVLYVTVYVSSLLFYRIITNSIVNINNLDIII